MIKQSAKPLRFALALSLLTAAAASSAELTVQIGAFGAEPKADYVDKAGQHGEVLVLRGVDNVTRVSVGRYDSSAAAESALARLHVAGYTDAYIANVRGYAKSAPAVGQSTIARESVAAESTKTAAHAIAPAVVRSSDTPRTITNPTTASTQRLPSGGQIVPPKQAAQTTSANSNPEEAGAASHAGRFRLRTHDTQSGETSDLKLQQATSPEMAAAGQNAVVAGPGANKVPRHLRNKLVYLDGAPHIKEDDRFIPLSDAVEAVEAE